MHLRLRQGFLLRVGFGGQVGATGRASRPAHLSYSPAMKTCSLATIMTLGVMLSAASAQERPNFSGTWTLAENAAVGQQAKPAPGFGQEITIWHDGNTFTV